MIEGDGSRGLPEHAPYDRILVSAAPARVPDALVAQHVGHELGVGPRPAADVVAPHVAAEIVVVHDVAEIPEAVPMPLLDLSLIESDSLIEFVLGWIARL